MSSMSSRKKGIREKTSAISGAPALGNSSFSENYQEDVLSVETSRQRSGKGNTERDTLQVKDIIVIYCNYWS